MQCIIFRKWFPGSHLSKSAGLGIFSNNTPILSVRLNSKNLSGSIGTRRADFIIEGKVLVKIKAIIELQDVSLAQNLNYLKAYKIEDGPLINFGSKSLAFKRIVP